MSFFTYSLTFLEGILSFISPCILPMLPIYLLYLAGSAGAEGVMPISSSTGLTKGQKHRLVLNSIGFVTGFTIVFLLLGLTATSFGHLLTSHRSLLQKASGILMILFGLNFIGLLKIRLLNQEKRLEYSVSHLNFLSSIVFGSVFGFGWTPCIGAFLGSALALAGNSSTIGRGVLLLLAYSFGLGIPFILSAVLYEQLKNSIRWLKQQSAKITFFSGILLVLEGILVFTDSLKYLDRFLQ